MLGQPPRENYYAAVDPNRMNMFKLPHELPVGAARRHMGGNEFLHWAAPTVGEHFRNEQQLLDHFDEVRRGPQGMRSEQIRSVVERPGGPPPIGQPVRNIQPQHRSQIELSDHASMSRVTGAPPPASGRRQATGQSQARYVPSVALLGQGENPANDRDVRGLQFATDAAHLQQAAVMAEQNARHMEGNRLRARQSTLAFGNYELNPGHHRLNAEVGRADDYGVDRLRSQHVYAPSSEVKSLLSDPMPGAPHILSTVDGRILPPPSATRPEEMSVGERNGRAARACNINFASDAPVDPPKHNPHAGRRAMSTVFGSASGPSGPLLAQGEPGRYVGLDPNGGPEIKYNPHAGRTSISKSLQDAGYLQDPHGSAQYTAAEHHRKRGALPAAARRVPVVEELVFGAALDPCDPHAQQPLDAEAKAEGKRALGGARAAQTNVGPRELGGAEDPAHPDLPDQRFYHGTERKYADHRDMLHYQEHADGGHIQPSAFSRAPSGVGQAMNFGDVPPSACSDEPRGLPKRHPGPERLRRGRGVDGEGHDHRGRQLATSLVDEVVFNRSPIKGVMPLGAQGVNFSINEQGEFAGR